MGREGGVGVTEPQRSLSDGLMPERPAVVGGGKDCTVVSTARGQNRQSPPWEAAPSTWGRYLSGSLGEEEGVAVRELKGNGEETQER